MTLGHLEKWQGRKEMYGVLRLRETVLDDAVWAPPDLARARAASNHPDNGP